MEGRKENKEWFIHKYICKELLNCSFHSSVFQACPTVATVISEECLLLLLLLIWEQSRGSSIISLSPKIWLLTFPRYRHDVYCLDMLPSSKHAKPWPISKAKERKKKKIFLRIKWCEPAGNGEEKSALVISVCPHLGITLQKIANVTLWRRKKRKGVLRCKSKKGETAEKIIIYLFSLIYVSDEAESCQIASFRQLEVTVGNRSMYGSKSRKA